MSPPHAPYPPDLTWRVTVPRQLIFNELSILGGSMMLSRVEMLFPSSPGIDTWLYSLAWMQCVACFGMLNLVSLMLVARAGWRRVPDAATRYELNGRFMTLPWGVRVVLCLMTIVSLPMLAWLGLQTFGALQSTPWGRETLLQAPVSYANALSCLAYGGISSWLFEYFCEREAMHRNRARLAEKLSAEAQLNMLRSQLDPHLLFNTLSNLYELIDESPAQARAMLLNLIGFLRSTLTGSRATQHALSQEFKLASDYLALMQIRMGDRLSTTLELPPHLDHAVVPAMLLQPLVENAIKHGLEPRPGKGTLAVAASSEADVLVLRVGNSGAGEEGTRPVAGTAADEGGFGLQYVRERLRALYGEAASFDMRRSSQEDFTWVTLRLPLTTASSTKSHA